MSWDFFLVVKNGAAVAPFIFYAFGHFNQNTDGLKDNGKRLTISAKAFR